MSSQAPLGGFCVDVGLHTELSVRTGRGTSRGAARRVAILGSTGSIGRSAVDVIAHSRGELQAVALCAHRRLDLLAEQARALRPRWAVITDAGAVAHFDRSSWPTGVELLVGAEALEAIVADSEVDMVLSAIVGSAGLRSTWAALQAGKPVALANKESLVVGGALLRELAQSRGTPLLPVDSEHSAIFQALQAGRRAELQRVILTASGGPFRHHTADQLARVSVADALAHPTWNMGPKITIDSATLMNKALEIIEARWLFDLRPDQIAVMLHPQSIVHSLVEFVDGSIIAQLGPPDMRLPIQYALTFPHRRPGVAHRLDWSQTYRLELIPPDLERHDALRLGFEVARQGGSAGAVLNAANEAAVNAFLQGTIGFPAIVPLCRTVLEAHAWEPRPSLERLAEWDAWARAEVARRLP